MANVVTVLTKHPEDKAYVWKSDSKGTFTIEDYTEEFNRGTRIILDLKEDCAQYLESDKLKEIIKKYSEFTTFPILFAEENENK